MVRTNQKTLSMINLLLLTLTLRTVEKRQSSRPFQLTITHKDIKKGYPLNPFQSTPCTLWFQR